VVKYEKKKKLVHAVACCGEEEGVHAMKNSMSIRILVLTAVLFGTVAAIAEEKPMYASVTHSKDFDRMKELVGVWEGKTDMGKGMENLRVTYELTSAGNALIERLDAGRPHEMVTVYYDYNGNLAMTHYCVLGNQPHMVLSNPGESNLTFTLSEKMPGLVSSNEMHMHSLTIAFDGKDAVIETWTLYDNGARKSDHVIKLFRAKS